MENKDAELGRGQLSTLRTKLLASNLDILLQLLDGVLESSTGIVDLVDNEDALANQVLHGTQCSKVQPLSTGDLGSDLLDLGLLAEGLVERETDGLDGNVGRAGPLEEGSQDTGGNVTAATDGNYKLRLELAQKTIGRLLAQLVHLLE